MESLVAIAGLMFVGAITPGPNNFIVLREASRGGWAGALPSVLGVIGGGLALLAVVMIGGGGLFAAAPRASLWIAIAGGAYLALLGGRLVVDSLRRERAADEPEGDGLPVGVRGLFVFQFLNPKAWVLVVTIVAAAQAALPALLRWTALVAVYLLIMVVSLGVWTLVGVALMRYLRRDRVRRWVDRVMGMLLIAFATLLVVEQLPGR